MQRREIHHAGLGISRVIEAETQSEIDRLALQQLEEWHVTFLAQQRVAKRMVPPPPIIAPGGLRTDRRQEAQNLTEKSKKEFESIQFLLKDSLERNARIDLNTLLDRQEFKTPAPIHKQFPDPVLAERTAPPSISEMSFAPEIGWKEKLSSRLWHEKELEAKAKYQAQFDAWQQADRRIDSRNAQLIADHRDLQAKADETYAAALKIWETQRGEFLKAQSAKNANALEFIAAYRQGDPTAVVRYFQMVLKASPYPASFSNTWEIAFRADLNQLSVRAHLPEPGQLPKYRRFRYSESRDVVEEEYIPTPVLHGVYETVLNQIALRTFHEIFEADEFARIEEIVYDGWVHRLNPATGRDEEASIRQASVQRQRFLTIDLSRVDPKACFESLSL